MMMDLVILILLFQPVYFLYPKDMYQIIQIAMTAMNLFMHCQYWHFGVIDEFFCMQGFKQLAKKIMRRLGPQPADHTDNKFASVVHRFHPKPTRRHALKAKRLMPVFADNNPSCPSSLGGEGGGTPIGAASDEGAVQRVLRPPILAEPPLIRPAHLTGRGSTFPRKGGREGKSMGVDFGITARNPG